MDYNRMSEFVAIDFGTTNALRIPEGPIESEGCTELVSPDKLKDCQDEKVEIKARGPIIRICFSDLTDIEVPDNAWDYDRVISQHLARCDFSSKLPKTIIKKGKDNSEREWKIFQKSMMTEYDENHKLKYKGGYYNDIRQLYPYHGKGIEFKDNIIVRRGEYFQGSFIDPDIERQYEQHLHSSIHTLLKRINEQVLLEDGTHKNNNDESIASDTIIAQDTVKDMCDYYGVQDQPMTSDICYPSNLLANTTDYELRTYDSVVDPYGMRINTSSSLRRISLEPCQIPFSSSLVLRNMDALESIAIGEFCFCKMQIGDVDMKNGKVMNVKQQKVKEKMMTEGYDGYDRVVKYFNNPYTRFEDVSFTFCLAHLHALETLVIGRGCFVATSSFEIKDCPKLQRIIIGNENEETENSFSFLNCTSFTLEKLESLEVMDIFGSFMFRNVTHFVLNELKELKHFSVKGYYCFSGDRNVSSFSICNVDQLELIDVNMGDGCKEHDDNTRPFSHYGCDPCVHTKQQSLLDCVMVLLGRKC